MIFGNPMDDTTFRFDTPTMNSDSMFQDSSEPQSDTPVNEPPVGLQPMVYEIYKDKKLGYNLTMSVPYYEIPRKLYGDMLSVNRKIWLRYARKHGSTGAMFIGDKGSGKTEATKVLANIAISNNIPVVIIKEINADIQLVRYISKLTRVVIIFEEFGKNFNQKLQEKMLSMLSDMENTKKLFLISENSEYLLNDMIKDRLGRIHYRKDFNRISKDDVIEYCEDHKVDKDFINELLIKHGDSTVFSYDLLIGIVDEHKDYPEESLDDLLKVLNAKILIKPLYLDPFYAVGIDNEKEFRVEMNTTMKKDNFFRGASGMITLYDIELEEKINDMESKANTLSQKEQMELSSMKVSSNHTAFISKSKIKKVLDNGLILRTKAGKEEVDVHVQFKTM